MYLVKVQEMRGVAAFLVTLTHFNYLFNVVPYFNSSIGVDIFFIISGFLMAYILEKKKYKAGEFLSRRILRIIPLYFICTLFIVFLKILSGQDFNIYDSIRSFLFYPFIGNEWNDLIIAPGWTLVFELFFYVLVLIKIIWNKNGFLYLALVWIPIIFIYESINIDYRINILNVLFNSLNIEFLYGVLAYYLYKNISFNIFSLKIIFIFSFICLLLLSLYSDDSVSFELIPRDTIYISGISFPRFITWGIPAFLFFISFVNLKSRSKILENIGEWSYSLYLLQYIFIGLLSKFLIFLEINIENYSVFLRLFFLLISLIAILLISKLSYTFIEVKIDKKIKKVLTRINSF